MDVAESCDDGVDVAWQPGRWIHLIHQDDLFQVFERDPPFGRLVVAPRSEAARKIAPNRLVRLLVDGDLAQMTGGQTDFAAKSPELGCKRRVAHGGDRLSHVQGVAIGRLGFDDEMSTACESRSVNRHLKSPRRRRRRQEVSSPMMLCSSPNRESAICSTRRDGSR